MSYRLLRAGSTRTVTTNWMARYYLVHGAGEYTFPRLESYIFNQPPVPRS